MKAYPPSLWLCYHFRAARSARPSCLLSSAKKAHVTRAYAHMHVACTSMCYRVMRWCSPAISLALPWSISASCSSAISRAICGTRAQRESQSRSFHGSSRGMWVTRDTAIWHRRMRRSCMTGHCGRAHACSCSCDAPSCCEVVRAPIRARWRTWSRRWCAGRHKSEEHRRSAQAHVRDSAAATSSEAGIWSGVVGRGGVATGARCVCARRPSCGMWKPGRAPTR